MASTYLSRTPASTGNRKTFTISCWLKRSNLGGGKIITGINDGVAPYARIFFDTNDVLKIEDDNGSTVTNIVTNRKFRDVSAWYHLVIAYDTTQATASDRVKMYVNGVQETSFSSSTYPSQNFDTEYNKASTALNIGKFSSSYYDGSMSHVHLIDGTAYDASAFGETDSTTGIWKAKTAPSVTYGTNGFFLKFENSGAFGTDSSPNGNNFTVNGTMTQTIDTPSNVFTTYIDGSYTASAQTPQNKDTDILSLALDLDSGTKTLKIYKNGTQLTSGGTVNLSSYYNDTLIFPCFSGNSSSASCSFNLNFGNGVFGSTPLTGTTYSDTSGLGIFKYEVPAGYYALCTKNINTQEYN
jgi:hypothetical protein